MMEKLPPFLLQTEPMEIEDLPLQVSLLTLEIANMRRSLQAIADLVEKIAMQIRPPEAPQE